MEQAHPPHTGTRDGRIPGLEDEESRKAAELIQRTFRGHRTRRSLNGFGIDASTRWYEAVKDARYQKTTTPAPPNADDADGARGVSPGRSRWQRAMEIAKHAGADDRSPTESDTSLSDDSSTARDDHGAGAGPPTARKRRATATEQRKRTAKMMDLQYFLEMVDQKHRYGSNLRKYHNYWKSQDTTQNFFYWLDQGEGRQVDLPECSRQRLDREQVRYLSREERLNYLVQIDQRGQLVWAKNNHRVWTKDELYKDSVWGIVPVTDPTPTWTHDGPKAPPDPDTESSEDSSDEDDSKEKSGREGERYVNEEFHRSKGPAKLKHVSAAVLFNHMVRSSMKKGHKWIFVCDTSFRLYIGYKQSGAFQHSSFLHGARILAAGLIKVKDGQLRRLSPLSGHYRPPAANFRAFVHSLRDEGCDMSRVSISRSYAVLVGLEGYVKTRRKVKSAEKTVGHEFDKVVRPDKVKQEAEAAQDHSQSAAKERLYLEQQRLRRGQDAGARSSTSHRLSARFSRAWDRFTGKTAAVDHQGVSRERGVPGTAPEERVPAPEGKR